MKLNINGETILVDFKYERDVRSLKERDSPKYNRIRRHYMLEPVVDIVKVTCTIKRALFEDFVGIYVCDVDNFNKKYARKIALREALNEGLKDFKKLREDIWTEYFENLVEDLNPDEYILENEGVTLVVQNIVEKVGIFINENVIDKTLCVLLNKQETQNLIKSLQKQVKYL